MPGLEGTLADAMVTLLPLTGALQQFSLSPRNPERDLRQGAAVPAYLKLGVEHLIFGIDHVCFVLLPVFLYPTLRQLLHIVTSFTAAHSLTLALASLGVLTLPGGPVEALIALSTVLLAVVPLAAKGDGGTGARTQETVLCLWVTSRALVCRGAWEPGSAAPGHLLGPAAL